MGWIAAGDYEITLRDDAVVCRNSAGKELKSLPKAVKDSPEAIQLREALVWLERHAAQCRAVVETWLVRSLPVPVAVLAQVWADEAWRGVLQDAVIAESGRDGGFVPETVGFLREAGPQGVRVVNLDGETVAVDAPVLAIPHPVLLDDLPDLQEFAADLGVRQGAEQLFRQTYVKPADLATGASGISEFSGGKFDQLRFAFGRASSLGYQVRGGYATTRIVEGGHTVEARYWLGEGDPWDDVWTGDLVFTDGTGHSVPLAEVGPVAWSEGMRMAAAIWAGRKTDDDKEDSR